MGKYFIHKHCEATEKVTICIDLVQDYYYGNNPRGGYISKYFTPRSFEIEQYGFNTIEEAAPLYEKMRAAAEAETANGFWTTTVSIVRL